MNTKNVRSVIAALRSGEYTQCGGALRRVTGFCCLGVACDVYAKSQGGEWEINSFQGSWSSTPSFEVNSFQGSEARLPQAVKEWLGFSTGGGPPACGYLNSIEANDSGHSFKEIATAWERLANDLVEIKL